PYVKHPCNGSSRDTGQSLRQLKLRIDAENKFLTTVLLEEWDRVEKDLDPSSPFFRKIAHDVIAVRESLHEGLPGWPFRSRDVLLNPPSGKTMTESERFEVYMADRFLVLCHSYEFVRLLRASTQTTAVEQATERLERVFDEALAEIARNVEFDRFEAISCHSL